MGECWWPCCHDFLFSSSSPLHKLDYKSTGKLLCSTSLFLLFHFYHRVPTSLFAGVPFNLHIPCADKTSLFNSIDTVHQDLEPGIIYSAVLQDLELYLLLHPPQTLDQNDA